MKRALILILLAAPTALADPIEPIKRRIPPPGIQLPKEQRAALKAALSELSVSIEKLRREQPAASRWLPDVEVYVNAVELALAHDEFYKDTDFDIAREALETAKSRLKHLQEIGERANRDESAIEPHDLNWWGKPHRRIVRGYRSSIDGYSQPYGLEIPDDARGKRGRIPLYVWLHGRGDKTTNLHFIDQRENRPGKIAPKGALVLHPFGRHCMGFKSAGEVDVLEAIEHVCSEYPIDRDRIVLMGFSMGGAGAWHIGAHYADRFVAMSPGAGFAETAEYNRLKPDDFPSKYEQQLWTLYDVPNYTRNLFNLPVVAYSGENDKQIQAAQVMERAFASHGKKLTHIIGPGMGHKYHPDSLAEIMRQMNDAVERGSYSYPKRISLQTRTLRYSKVHFVSVTQLEQHWEDTRLDLERTDDHHFIIKTKNVAAFVLHSRPRKITVDGQEVEFKPLRTSGELDVHLSKRDGVWRWSDSKRKIPKLLKHRANQGPIDDAFVEPFLVVAPSGKSKHPAVQRWVEFELKHFEDRWRSLCRGKVRKKLDTEVTAEDIRDYNLILWGDANSNRLIARVMDQLPIQWDEKMLTVAGKKYDGATHVPLLVYPSAFPTERPYLSPFPTSKRYVVLNSGPTHREGHDRTNSLQNPKLPDWAVIDITQDPDEFTPGRVVAADFFDEEWQFKKRAKQRD